MKLFLASLLLFTSLFANAANFPFIRLNGKTNQVSDNGTALTRDGVPLGGGGSSLWTDFTDHISPSAFTNNFKLGTNGMVAIGPNSPLLTDGSSFYSTYLVAAGDPNYNELFLSILDTTGGGFKRSHFDTFGHANDWLTEQESIDTDQANVKTKIKLSTTPSDAYIEILAGNPFVEYAVLNPTVADGASAVAYTLNAPNLTNSTAKLLSLGTTSEKAAVMADGSLTTGGGSDKWIFKSVTEGVTTNIVVNINGKDYTIPAF